MFEGLEKSINDMLSDIKKLKDSFEQTLKKKEAHYAATVSRYDNLSKTGDNVVKSLQKQNDVAAEYVSSIKAANEKMLNEIENTQKTIDNITTEIVACNDLLIEFETRCEDVDARIEQIKAKVLSVAETMNELQRTQDNFARNTKTQYSDFCATTERKQQELSDDVKKIKATTMSTMSQAQADMAKTVKDAVSKLTNDINKESDKLKNIVGDMREYVTKTKNEVSDTCASFIKDQNEAKRNGETIIASFKEELDRYDDKRAMLDSSFAVSLDKIQSLSNEVKYIQDTQIANYSVATDEAKKYWEQSIINIINNNMEVVEVKSGLFKKNYMIRVKM